MSTSFPPNHLPNPLKAALARGNLQIGLWLALADPETCVVAAGEGYDWYLLDIDAGPPVVRKPDGCAGQGVSPVMRLTVKQIALMDGVRARGFRSFLVTGVETAALAQRVAASLLGDDTTPTEKAATCLLVQLHTRTALDNSAAIAAVPGIDGVVLSPSDLCADMGLSGKPDAAPVVSVIERGIAAVAGTGKACGLVCFKSTPLERYAQQGVTFMAVGGDATIAAKAMRQTSV